MKRIIVFISIVLVAGAFYWLTRPCLCIYGGSDKLVMTQVAKANMQLKISFIHSVQKTKVEEYLVVDDDLQGFTLESTHYHSFGVGLPFMESDGNFRREGDTFIMENMNRQFSELNLRTGVGTELTVTVDEHSYRLYEKFAAGEKIDIKLLPKYKIMTVHNIGGMFE